jgi:hypothetical protein
MLNQCPFRAVEWPYVPPNATAIGLLSTDEGFEVSGNASGLSAAAQRWRLRQ